MVRGYEDPLKPLPVNCWLVVKNEVGQTLQQRILVAGTNLRNEIVVERSAWSRDGWNIESMNQHSGGFFCHRDAERRFVHIVRYDPSKPSPTGHGSHLCRAYGTHSPAVDDPQPAETEINAGRKQLR